MTLSDNTAIRRYYIHCITSDEEGDRCIYIGPFETEVDSTFFGCEYCHDPRWNVVFVPERSDSFAPKTLLENA